MAEWLTLEELAAYLNRGRSTLYKMARNGQLPASKIGHSWRFDRSAIDEWLRRQLPQTAGRKARPKGRTTGRKSR